jgi:mono/diheme cytochrome c family protein
LSAGRLPCVALWVVVGCSRAVTVVEPALSLERMQVQPRTDPYAESALFADGRAMRTPPAGTVPRERVLGPSSLVHGTDGGRYVERFPLPVTRALVEQGRAHFDVVCATCHGLLGDGVSPVADAMTLRRPPSLHEPRLRAAAVGRLFEVASRGYGLMPSFAPYLDVEARWSVVAYVRALQLARSAPAATLPADLRASLDRVAP